MGTVPMVVPGVSTHPRVPRAAFRRAAANDVLPPYSMSLTPQARKIITPRPLRDGNLYINHQGVIRKFHTKEPHKDVIGPKHAAGLKKSKRATSPDKYQTYQRLSLLIEMRDLLWEVLALQENVSDHAVAEGAEPPWVGAQKLLGEKHEFFLKNFGPLSREELRKTGRLDEYGEQGYNKSHINMKKFRKEPDAFRLLALLEKNYDPVTGNVEKGDIYADRLIAPRAEAGHVHSIDDALMESLSEKARVDLIYIAKLMGHGDAEEIRYVLEGSGKIFFDPEQQEWEIASTYLSGNVVKKLKAAQNALGDNPAMLRNVEALRMVMPKPLGKDHVKAKLGMHWIPSVYIEQFAEERLGLSNVKVHYFAPSHSWYVNSKVADKELAYNKFGKAGYSSSRVLHAALANKIPQLSRRKDGSERREESELEAVRAEFQEWLWGDEARSAHILKIFNEQFNAIVPPPVTEDIKLRFPGMNIKVKPRNLQQHAVFRGLQNGNTLFAHGVGAGKTFTSIITAVEGKRLGKFNKPCFVLPLNMMDEFPQQCLKLYPQKNILVLSDSDYAEDGKNLTVPEKLEKLIARASDPDIDAIFMPQSVFDMLPLSPQTRLENAKRELENLQTHYKAIKGKSIIPLSLTSHVEQLIQQKKMYVSELEIEAESDAPEVSFEQAGIDCILADEVHAYKKLTIESKIEGVAQEGSKRADNLVEILSYLRTQNETHHFYSMTATPLSNSILEAYTWQKFMQPDLLEEMGLAHIDAWMAMFGDVREVTEIAPEGDHLRKITRLADLQNLPTLMRMFHCNADVAKNLLEKPQKNEHVVWLERNPVLDEFFERLTKRAKRVRAGKVKNKDDNMLKIIMEGRLASLDPRLVGLKPDPSVPTKLEFIADRLSEAYHNHKDEFLVDKEGNAAEAPGVLGAMMCDLAILNGATGISAYEILKEYLIERGVPHDMIDTVHQYQSPDKKAELMHKCNTGQLGIVEGTTQRLGTGSNIQKYLKTLLHADVTWRPMDMIQRNGRIERPGNLNSEVEVYYPIVKDTFDPYMWQTMRRKQSFIDSFMNFDLSMSAVTDHDPMLDLCEKIWEVSSADLEITKDQNPEPDQGEQLSYEPELS